MFYGKPPVQTSKTQVVEKQSDLYELLKAGKDDEVVFASPGNVGQVVNQGGLYDLLPKAETQATQTTSPKASEDEKAGEQS